MNIPLDERPKNTHFFTWVSGYDKNIVPRNDLWVGKYNGPKLVQIWNFSYGLKSYKTQKHCVKNTLRNRKFKHKTQITLLDYMNLTWLCTVAIFSFIISSSACPAVWLSSMLWTLTSASLKNRKNVPLYFWHLSILLILWFSSRPNLLVPWKACECWIQVRQHRVFPVDFRYRLR